jgi:quercetin dioxygenase-like cupin family protein
MKMLRQLLPLHASALLLASGFSLPALAADDVFMNNNDIKWGPAPPSLPKGAKAAVLYGDPGKSGPYVIRLMAPPNYKVPPHWHTQAESITVLSGTLYLGTGDKMDAAHAHALKTGGYHYLPGQVHHYAFTKTPTVIQVNADGPFDITYINPDDDPQKAAKK